MWTLAAAIFFASLLGSMHCVGMCGPLAIWATAGGQARGSIITYHLGRLTTYLSAGLVAGVLGTVVGITGEFAGFQMLAARIAGGLLVVFGVIRLAQLVPRRRATQETSEGVVASINKPSKIAALLQRAKPILASQGPLSRAYFGGVLTTWLPCGWLYLFVLIAAGTGSVVSAVTVMFAFWVGTLPALTGVVLGARTLVPRFKSVVPAAAGVLLVIFGLYTATGRASADLSTMLPPQTLPSLGDVDSMLNVADQPLPCCECEKDAAAGINDGSQPQLTESPGETVTETLSAADPLSE